MTHIQKAHFFSFRPILSFLLASPLSIRLIPLCSALQSQRHFSTKATMQTIRSDSLGGRGITFIPNSGVYKNVLVWMHGLGDTADGWASLMPSFGLKDTKFILPTANTRPISLNGGMKMPGWSDIYGLDIQSPEDEKGFVDSALRIDEIVQTEVDKGISSHNIIIGGFSQGGALALHVSLRSKHTLGGCIALSTWLPLRDDYPTQLSAAAAELKILQIHGDEDIVVSYVWGERSNQFLKTLLKGPIQFHTIQGMGHSSDPEEIGIVSKFLRDNFEK